MRSKCSEITIVLAFNEENMDTTAVIRTSVSLTSEYNNKFKSIHIHPPTSQLSSLTYSTSTDEHVITSRISSSPTCQAVASQRSSMDSPVAPVLFNQPINQQDDQFRTIELLLT